jgi:hypothetical protein
VAQDELKQKCALFTSMSLSQFNTSRKVIFFISNLWALNLNLIMYYVHVDTNTGE